METNLQLVLQEKLFEINQGVEEGLILMLMAEITKNVQEKKMKDAVKKTELLNINNGHEGKVKDNKKYYVYHSNSILDWEFNGYSTLKEAIKEAINYIDAYIIHNGSIIKYGVQNEKLAYCYNNNEKYLVQLS